MTCIPYDCWGIIFSYASNLREKEGPSDRSQCALTCQSFYRILRENTRARLLSTTPIHPNSKDVLIADSINGNLRAWIGHTLRCPILSIEKNGQFIGQIHPHAFPQVSFTPDQERMALSVGGFASVYRLFPFAAERLLCSQPGCVQTIAIAPDGQHVALGSTEIYKTDPGNCIRRLDYRAAPSDPVTFSPDGTRLASACQDARIIKIWKWQRPMQRPLHTLRSQDTPQEMAMSPNNKLLLIISQSRQVALLRIKTAETIWTLNYPEFPSYIGFSEEQVIAMTTRNKTVWEQRFPSLKMHKRPRTPQAASPTFL